MKMLQDHPNTIKLYDVYEDKESYHLILELCSGGELFDQIIAKGHFSEKDAAEKMHCLLDFIAYAHSKNIIHRDLKVSLTGAIILVVSETVQQLPYKGKLHAVHMTPLLAAWNPPYA